LSIETTKQVMMEFLTSDQHDVLALTGAWGVGKTYAWNQALMDNKNQIKLSKYCYVSLFGINTLAELRTSLFVKTKAVKMLGTSLNAETINQNWATLASSGLGQVYARFGSLLKGIPHGSNISVGIEALAQHFVRDTLICLDDFERQTALKVEDILGLISELKEEKGCKVALIFNAEQLGAKDDYRAYKEKVVDYEVLYAPTVNEAFDLVFDRLFPNRDLVFRHVSALEITNIRILRKIQGVLKRIGAAALGMHPVVLEASIVTTILLCWCAYAPDADKPKIEEINSWNKALMSFKTEKDQKGDPTWVGCLKEYGFTHIDDLDLAIARIVERGYIEGTGFLEAAHILDTELRGKDKAKDFSNAWNQFHSTLTDNQDDFIGQLYGSTRQGAETIGSGDLNSTVVLLRQLKRDDLADELIKHYVDTHKDQPNIFDLSEHPFGGSIDDPALRKTFDDTYAAHRRLPTLEESVIFMVEHSGHNQEHIEAMMSATVDDYYRLFTTPHEGARLSDLIKLTLRFNSGEEALIGKKAREALNQIKGKSLLNAIRLGKYGI